MIKFSQSGPVASEEQMQVKEPPGSGLQVPPYLQGDLAQGKIPAAASLPGVVAETEWIKKCNICKVELRVHWP